MRRFIRYLYEYENGQRIRNVGFVKVDEKPESTTVSIHGKGLRLNGDEVMKLYIFYMDENVCRGIWQGDIKDVNPALNYRLIFTKEDTGRPENYSQIEGIILSVSDGRKFAAAWNDVEVHVDGMRMWDAYEEIDAYISPSNPAYEKIERRDIARLPRCEWRLANNSFLMHGYRNYHHLIFLEDEEGLWLGVPGIYHEKEGKAAEAFGFPRYLEGEEEDFGYWCRKVKKPSKEEMKKLI